MEIPVQNLLSFVFKTENSENTFIYGKTIFSKIIFSKILKEKII